MSKFAANSILPAILKESGFIKCSWCLLDTRFVFAVCAGAIFIYLSHGLIPALSEPFKLTWTVIITLTLWQPAIEETLFRGLLQGQLLKKVWAAKTYYRISYANLITSVLFVMMHMIHTSFLWSLMIIIPSLVFGYFRDTFNSIIPSITLHILYNSFVVTGIYFSEHTVNAL